MLHVPPEVFSSLAANTYWKTLDITYRCPDLVSKAGASGTSIFSWPKSRELRAFAQTEKFLGCAIL